MFKLSSVDLDVRLEGYKIDPKAISIESGVNKILSANIVLPSAKWAQQIMPGTRVHIYISINNGPKITYFEGYVIKRPIVHAGTDAKDVSLTAAADMAVLSDARIQYFDLINTRGQMGPGPAIQRMFLKAEGGTIRIPINNGLPSMTPFAGLSNVNTPFAARIYGVLQSVLMLSPNLYNIMRRTQLFDKLMIDINNNAADIDKTDFAHNLMHQLNSMITKESSAMTMLMMILNSIHHDFTSVAPMMRVNTKLPLRESQLYLPKGFDILKTGQPESIFNEMQALHKTTKNDHTTFIDHIVKPIMIGMPIPYVNYLYGDDFLSFSIGPKQITRLLAELPIRIPGIYQSIINRRPYEVKTAMEVALKAMETSRAETSMKHAAYSLLISSLGTDYMTNEEKLFNSTIPSYWQGDYRMAQLLLHMQNSTDREMFFEDWVDVEYEKQTGVNVTVAGPLNLDPVCGFPMKIFDNVSDNTVTGYLFSKVDIIDFEADVASTTYNLTAANKTNDVNFSQPKFSTKSGDVPYIDFSGATELSDIFYSIEEDDDIPSYMKGKNYDYRPLYSNITGATPTKNEDGSVEYQDTTSQTGSYSRDNFVSQEESFARIAVMRKTDDIFVADDRSLDDISYGFTGFPSSEVISNVISYYQGSNAEINRERYYSNADMLSYIIEKKFIIGTSTQQRLKGLNLLDSREGSIFSMYYKANQKAVPGNEMTDEFGSDTKWYYGILSEEDNVVEGVHIKGPKVMWDGRPSVDRTELLMHYVSVSQDKINIEAIKGSKDINTVIPKENGKLKYSKVVEKEKGVRRYKSLEYIPRPMSESEVISVRRWVIEQLYKESNKHVR